MIKTEAWVLHQGDGSVPAKTAQLELETFTFPDITDEEVLVEPLYGCWEGNMTHALDRDPIDICLARKESKVVIGNAGVVRVLQVGKKVKSLKERDQALVFCNSVSDKFGYPEKIYAYDSPNTIGLLAKQTKLHHNSLIKIPDNSKYSLAQWAAFSLRYITAWANWKVAYGCWRVQMPEAPAPNVWGWGGGVTFAQLSLAKLYGCQATMITSSNQRIKLIEGAGIMSLDRREFPDLEFNEAKFNQDKNYRQKYLASEKIFMEEVKRGTQGFGVDIFVDYVGAPVLRATLKALARQGVITTAGWREGMQINSFRAIECIQRHLHVNTHYARRSEAIEAMEFAEAKGWMAPVESKPWGWNAIPDLVSANQNATVEDFYPIFTINEAGEMNHRRPLKKSA